MRRGWLAAALLVTSLWSGTPAFAYSIGEEVKIDVSQPEISKAGFDISSDYAVWMVEGENTITLYDLDKNTETDIGDKNSTKTNPYVDGNYVVWIDSRDGGSDVYMYDIAKKKETRITDGSAEVSSLEIAGKNIVWADKREGGSDIYLERFC
jgi:beta propeller repeat protein